MLIEVVVAYVSDTSQAYEFVARKLLPVAPLDLEHEGMPRSIRKFNRKVPRVNALRASGGIPRAPRPAGFLPVFIYGCGTHCDGLFI